MNVHVLTLLVYNHKHFRSPEIDNAGYLIYEIKLLLLRAIIIAASKLPIGPLTSIHGFHTFHDVFTRGETWSWNQRHGSIIHTYYKNTASKDTYRITISEGYAFSTSWFHKHTHTRKKCKHFIFHFFDITNVIREGVLICDFCNWLITLMSIAIHNGRWRIRKGLLVSESDPLTEGETQGNGEKGDAAVLKHPWNQINEPYGSGDGITQQHLQNSGMK